MRGNLKSARLRLLGLLLLFLITASGVFAFHAEKSHQGKPAVSVETALKAIDFAAENDISIDSEFSANLRQTINFNRNRYYSPALGRFVSKDPIGFDADGNLYRYADGNPVLNTDPEGKAALTSTALAVTITALVAVKYTQMSAAERAQIANDFKAYISKTIDDQCKRAELTYAALQAMWEDYVYQAKGERNWEKPKGNDPFWDLTDKELRDKEKYGTQSERERAQRIRKQRSKKRDPQSGKKK